MKKTKLLQLLLSTIFLCVTTHSTVYAETTVDENGCAIYTLPDGAKTQSSIYDDNLSQTSIYTYNEHGQVIIEDIYYYSYPEQTVSSYSHKLYTYNENRQIATEDTYAYSLPNETLIAHNQILYTYNPQGNLIKVSNYHGANTSIHVYKYNDQGQLIEEGDPSNDSYYANTRYEYDKNKIIEYKNNSITHNWYNENRQLLLKEMYWNPLSSSICQYIYDDNGKLVRIINDYSPYLGGSDQLITDYTYDSYGNLDIVHQHGRAFDLELPYCGWYDVDTTTTYVKQYDEQGRLLQIGTVSEEGFTGYLYTY